MSTSFKPRGIIVGVDGSSASDAAVCWATRDAALRHIPLNIVHVVNPVTTTWSEIPLPGGVAMWQESEGRMVLEDAVKIAEKTAKNDRSITITSEMIFWSTVPKLVELSKQAQMLVVGNHGRGKLTRGSLGSVSSSLLQLANCPVAVIRDDESLTPHVEQAPVLVGIDGSAVSEAAMTVAFEEASHRGVDLLAVHAWSDVEVFELPGLDWRTLKAEEERSLAERLAGWQEQYPDVTVHRLLICDRPAHMLTEKSKTAQLLVVGSHGRGGFSGTLLGSVSNAVVQSVRAPVIVVRPS